jgi:diacylglycerol kinase family enzyme/molybdopterin converting factor small subunit
VARVRLFASLREEAGAARLEVDGATVDDVVTALTVRFGAKFGEIARVGSVVVDGERAEFDAKIGPDQEVALLPPVSGGTGARPRPQRVLLVANPVARTVSRPVLDVIEKALAADFKLEVDETRRRGHATEMAQEAVRDGYDMMVVFSGDGTINEAVNGLVGSEVALGVLPGGATNVLARVTGMPNDPVEATSWLINAALEGRARRLGLGHIEDRYFVLNCGAGLDADVMARVDERQATSRSQYERAALAAVLRNVLGRYAGRSPFMTVRVDDGPPVGAITVFTGRCDPYSFYKNARLRLTPNARLDDGLDATVFERLPRWSSPALVRQVFSGGLIKRKGVHAYHDAARIEIVGHEPFPVQVDGDYIGTRERLDIGLLRDALWLVA